MLLENLAFEILDFLVLFHLNAEKCISCCNLLFSHLYIVKFRKPSIKNCLKYSQSMAYITETLLGLAIWVKRCIELP